mgnify:CR=1 FL=1
MADVAVLHHVFLALDAQLARFLDRLLALVLLKVLDGVDLRSDEAPFEVGVNHARGLRRGGPDGNGPGADFLRPRGEVALQAQELVRGVRHGIEGRLLEPQCLEHFRPISIRHLGKLGLDLRADGDDLGVLLLRVLAHLHAGLGGAFQVVLVHVHDVKDFLGGDEAEALEHFLLLGIVDLDGAGRLAAFERGLELLEHLVAGHLLGLAALGGSLGLGERALDGLEVGEHQFRGDDLDVADGIDGARDVDDVLAAGGFGEAADDLQNGVHLADVGEELVAQPLALAGPLDDARDVHEPERRGNDLLRRDVLRDDVHPLVGDGHDPDVGLDGGEGIVRGERAGLRERVEEGALADVGETDDACFHRTEFR